MSTSFYTQNPATLETLQTYHEMTSSEMEIAISASERTFKHWKTTSFRERSLLFNRLADVLEKRKGSLSELMAFEMGKPLHESVAEVEKCAWVCRYYAENGASMLSSETIDTSASKSFVSYQPIGTVLGIMPWNFPLWQVYRYAVPTLFAGNTTLMKHASVTTGCGLAIAASFIEAGFPEGIFQTIIADNALIADVIGDTRIQAVTLTGSTRAGKSVAETAGKHLKKCVLELGGSDPYLILEDADISLAAEKCATSRLLNTGQSCIAAKRFIVVESVYEEFLGAFTKELRKRKVGDPFSEGSDLGPLARVDLRDALHNQVEQTIQAGARLVFGGINSLDAAFYPITLLAEVPEDSVGGTDELFGPVACVFKVKDEVSAIEFANKSQFGLGAAVFSRNYKRAEFIAEHKLEAGACFVNDFVRSDPRLPFGGIKQSGFGRELGAFGIKEFVNIKTVYVA